MSPWCLRHYASASVILWTRLYYSTCVLFVDVELYRLTVQRQHWHCWLCSYCHHTISSGSPPSLCSLNALVFAILLFTLYMYCLTWCVTMVTGTCMCCCYLTCTCIQDKCTPVYIAARNGHVGALKALISAGAELSTANVVSTWQFLYIIIVCTIPQFGIQIRGKVQK